jgi:putative ABC transport system permease protein
MVNPMFSDLRYAFRMMRKAPVFTAIAVATIALGIGANTAIVSVIDNLLFRPPHFPHVERLVYIIDTNPEKVPPGVEPGPSPGNVFDWRSAARSFDNMIVWRNWYYAVRRSASSDLPESVRGVRVSTSFFAMLGVEPALGRTFRSEEGITGRDDVAVLSHGLWIRQFSGDPAIVGRQILVGARPRTVIGVLPQKFQFLQPDLDLWMPLPEESLLRDDR